MRRVLLWLNFPFAWSIFLAVSAVNVVLGFVCQLLALPWDPQRRVALKLNHWIWGRCLFPAEPGWSSSYEGLEHVGEGPYVIVANHSSVLDIPTLMHLPLPMRVLAKKSLIRAPIMGWYMGFSGQIPIDLSDPADVQATVQRCIDSLNQGISVVIFPEGSRSEDGEIQSFRRGAFRLAKDTGVPILPVSISGTHKIMQKGKFMPQSIVQHVRCRVLPPMSGEHYSTARKLSNRAHEAISGSLAELRQPRELAGA
jgi:1-acyl-sn-glycerol-3-phosphate acyltransferase